MSAYMGPNLGSWWRNQMEPFSVLLALCAGNSLVTGEFPTQRPVMRGFVLFFDLHLNKRLSKQSWGWWFETSSLSLWRHCNVWMYSQMTSTWAPFQYLIGRLIERSRTAADVPVKFQKRCDDLNCQSRGFETTRDLTIRRRIGYWNGALIIHQQIQCGLKLDIFLFKYLSFYWFPTLFMDWIIVIIQNGRQDLAKCSHRLRDLAGNFVCEHFLIRILVRA